MPTKRATPVRLKPPYPPMDAESVDEIPTGNVWQYEPKWDGFRCLAFRDRGHIQLQSKAGQPLQRYFPDLVEVLSSLAARRFVLDGEIVIPMGSRICFDQLLQRIHPAESRVRKLASQHPALLIVFDLLAGEQGTPLIELRLAARRRRLEQFAKKHFMKQDRIRLSPATADFSTAKRWFRAAGGNLDGIIAKRLDLPYQSGNRDGMQKIKPRRTADCVVGGFRYASGKKVVGSLLLGLYDDQGLLNHVGFTSSFTAAERSKITEMVVPLIGPPGFTGRAPGGPSRWSTRRSSEWQPVRPKLVLEVEYDHFTGDRFRHGTRMVRWRPDKAPRQCLATQVALKGGSTLKLLKKGAS